MNTMNSSIVAAHRGGDGITMPNNRLHALTGWPMAHHARLDEAAPGHFLAATRARPVWRQAVAMAFAAGILDSPEWFLQSAYHSDFAPPPRRDPFGELSNAIRVMTAREIVAATFGEPCPPGLVGCLDRLGFQPLRSPETYLRLHRPFVSTEVADRRRRRVLTQLPRLDDEAIDVVENLNPHLLTARAVVQVGTLEWTSWLNGMVCIIQQHCSHASDAVIRQSLDQRGHGRSLRSWARDWLKRFDRGTASPFESTDELVVLDTGAKMTSAAIRYRNCLRDMVGGVIVGRNAYVEIKAEMAIAALVRTTHGVWALDRLHGHANRSVDADVYGRVDPKLRAVGVQTAVPIEIADGMKGVEALFEPFGPGVPRLGDFEGV